METLEIHQRAKKKNGKVKVLKLQTFLAFLGTKKKTNIHSKYGKFRKCLLR